MFKFCKQCVTCDKVSLWKLFVLGSKAFARTKWHLFFAWEHVTHVIILVFVSHNLSLFLL